MDFIHQIDHDPSYGAKWTLCSFGISLFIQFKFLEGEHVNPIIMDIFQLGAWAVAIVVGTFTAVSYVKKGMSWLKSKFSKPKK